MIKDFLQNIAVIQRKPTAQMPELFLLISKLYRSTPHASPEGSAASFLPDVPLPHTLSH